MKIVKYFLFAVGFLLQLSIGLNAQTNSYPSSGSVGIGTLSPAQLLHVRDGSANTGIIQLGGTSYYSQFKTDATLGGLRIINNWGGANSGVIAFENGTGPTERMRIDNNGNVGIGTTSPGALLDVSKGASGLGGEIIIRNTSQVSGNYSALSFSSASDVGSYQKGGIFYVSEETSGYGRGYFQFGLEATASGTNVTPANAVGMVIRNSGNVGIGITSPYRKLDVNGDANIATNLIVGTSIYTNTYTAGSSSAVTFKNSAGIDVITYLSGGNVGIGTVTPSEKLFVEGNISANGFITAKKLIVTQTGWSDYVFNRDYKLRSLQSLEAFIKENKHLPEVPTAKEVAAKGISVGDNQALLLKKIEELTLYVIELNKSNHVQKEINQKLINEIQQLKNKK